MAESSTTSTYNRLKILAGFVDEDDRIITLENPNTTLNLETQIKALEPLAANVIIGDKNAAAFSRFKAAKQVRGTTTSLKF